MKYNKEINKEAFTYSVLNRIFRDRLTTNFLEKLEKGIKENKNIIIYGESCSGKTSLLNFINMFLLKETERLTFFSSEIECEIFQKEYKNKKNIVKKNSYDFISKKETKTKKYVLLDEIVTGRKISNFFIFEPDITMNLKLKINSCDIPFIMTCHDNWILNFANYLKAKYWNSDYKQATEDFFYKTLIINTKRKKTQEIEFKILNTKEILNKYFDF